MYQVSWAVVDGEGGDPFENFDFLETWSEVRDWIVWVKADELVPYWSVSLVTDGSDDHMRSIDFGDNQEKGAYMFNINMLLPSMMNDQEVFATLMNVASRYWSQEDMVRGFMTCASASKDLPEPPKEPIH